VLASGADDDTVRLWDPYEAVPLHTFAGHDNSVEAVAFSSDGEVLASGGFDGDVRVWDVLEQTSMLTMESDGGTIWSLTFVPDSALVASGSADGKVRLWDAADGVLARTLESEHEEGVFFGAFGGVHAVVVDPTAAVLLSGGSEGIVQAWGIVEE
jgi:WD40 repeat protein